MVLDLLFIKCRTEKEMNRRKDMVANLRSKVNQMASTLNMSNFANRDSLLGPEIKPADAMNRTNGLDNQGIVGLQRQIIKEQDEGLEKLEETVMSTKHIALAVNEELDLHTKLINNLDQHVDVTDSRLQVTLLSNNIYHIIIKMFVKKKLLCTSFTIDLQASLCVSFYFCG
ncbi:syntaxin-51-like, partial [Olea europaea var. sylvestris]|uniref:syntaxin-51-like n=1 Tax=Olea europaea var. sylvestris TaxID=158386 RepID=UPI000C1CD2E6